MQVRQLILVSATIFLIYMADADATPPRGRSEPGDYKHFVLVHGACHGAWCWYKVAALLKSSGHNVTVLDLAASGINPKQAYEIPSISDYFMPLMDFMASLAPHGHKVILVAHSLGGLAVSQAMEKFPDKISVAVFVTAIMPGPNLNASAIYQETFTRLGAQLDNRLTHDNGPKNPTTFIFGPHYSATQVYQLSPPEDLALAISLLRPLRVYDAEDISRELKFSTKNYGSVRRAFIISDDDKVAAKDLQEWMIKENTPDEVEEIVRSDHMVMISRPLQLSLSLQRIANKFS